jgi:hypothetical protein
MSDTMVSGGRRGDARAEASPEDDERPDDEDGDAEDSDLEFEEMPCTDQGSDWEAFLPDEDEFDPQPDPGDFWMERSE